MAAESGHRHRLVRLDSAMMTLLNGVFAAKPGVVSESQCR